MIQPLGDRDEILVMDVSKELMVELRLAVLREFPKTWVLLHHDSVEEIYGIELCNIWGGRLPNEKEETIREYMEKFMFDRKDLD